MVDDVFVASDWHSRQFPQLHGALAITVTVTKMRNAKQTNMTIDIAIFLFEKRSAIDFITRKIVAKMNRGKSSISIY